ncbi:ACP S-malonyltransferase [Candidatus Fermentibacteria bacterium]|nr:ACP S-malonyltransferase [Candidatus Fermentibacteria bacterium]
MGRELASRCASAKAVFEMADDIMATPLTRIMWEGPEAALRETVFTQPAILAHSLALLATIHEIYGEVIPAVVAGHSLGEYSALVAAGVLTPCAALRIVKRRGELMHRAGETRQGAMAAVLGLDTPGVLHVLEAAQGAGIVVAANLNAPDQTVISGVPVAVDEAMKLAFEAGAARVVPLAVSGAFHSPLMAGVASELASVVHSVEFAEPACPVVPNVTGALTTSPAELRRCLLLQIESPVRWCDSMRAMAGSGTRTFLELGPGRVLAGLAKRIDRSVSVRSVSDLDALTTWDGFRESPRQEGLTIEGKEKRRDA